jgi:hypothetical protein
MFFGTTADVRSWQSGRSHNERLLNGRLWRKPDIRPDPRTSEGPKPDVGGTSWRGPEEELGRRLLASEILLGQISAENSDSASFLL